jgi:hypothetical protein
MQSLQALLSHREEELHQVRRERGAHTHREREREMQSLQALLSHREEELHQVRFRIARNLRPRGSSQGCVGWLTSTCGSERVYSDAKVANRNALYVTLAKVWHGATENGP